MLASRSPDGFATAPTRITWAPPAAPAPVGSSVASAEAWRRQGAGAGEQDRRRIGGAISTAEAIAACQLELGASTTAWG